MERKGLLTRNQHTTYLQHYIGQVLNYVARKKRNIGTTNVVRNIDDREKQDCNMGGEELLNVKNVNSKEVLVEQLVKLQVLIKQELLQ